MKLWIWILNTATFKKTENLVFKTDYPLMQVESIAECSAGQKYCRMLQREHSAILLTFIKLPFVLKIMFFVYFRVAVLHRVYCIFLAQIDTTVQFFL